MFQKIGIVGLGLIGGSIALAVRERWPLSQLVGVDHATVLESAKRLHVVDEVGEELTTLAGADLIILAAPIRQNLLVLDRLERAVPGAAVVTDTGSTKREIVERAGRLPSRLTFIGGHPLGGAAAGGLAHARADMFKERPWLFTPGPPHTSGQPLEALLNMVTAFGSMPHVMDAATHDRFLAFISHLPQMAASALMDVIGDAVGEDALALAGRGLSDTTRLASSPAMIWKDIAASNADEIGPALDALIARLQDLRQDLSGGDRLRATFERAAQWRARVPVRS